MDVKMTCNRAQRAEKSESLLKSAWLIAVVIVISKIIGFLRDLVIANFYGAGLVSDSYFYAYQIPSLAIILLGGVGGPFHSAVVSVFSKLIPDTHQKADEGLNKLFNTFLTGTLIIFVILGVLIFTFSDVIMQFIISGGSPELVGLASKHLKIMSPVFVIGGVVGIYYGVLVSYKKFMIPNISPILMSLAIIIIISLAKHDSTGTILAAATTVGAVCQFLFQLPKLKQLGYSFKPNLDFFNNPHFKTMLELLFPAILSSTVGQIHIYVDMFFASSLKEGAWSAIGYANRIFQFPVGILVTAFLVPLFPLFSKLVAEQKYEDIKYYFNKGVGLLNLASFPILIGIVLLGYDGIKLVFERGAFGSDATFMVSEALLFLSVSLLPYVFRDSITRVYYAFNDSKTPFLVAFGSIVLKFLLNWLMVPRMGIGGITLSTSLVTLWNAAVLGFFLRRKMRLGYRQYFVDLSKMFVAAILTYICSFFIYKGLVQANLPLLINLLVMLFVICLVYAILVWVLRVPYGRELIERVKMKVIKNG